MLKSHGTETRGGYVRAQLVIAPEYVDSPVVETADVFVAFSAPAYKRFFDLCRGWILYDPEMVDDIRPDAPERHVAVPATQLSKERFSNVLFANMIMLGALTRLAGLDYEAMKRDHAGSHPALPRAEPGGARSRPRRCPPSSPAPDVIVPVLAAARPWHGRGPPTCRTRSSTRACRPGGCSSVTSPRFAERVAVRELDHETLAEGRTLTYEALWAAVRGAASGLRARGCRAPARASASACRTAPR